VANHPQNESRGKRTIKLTRELWIERGDFMAEPAKKYFRLFPGNQVRLRHGYVVTCTDFKKDDHGHITEVHCEYLPDTKSGTAGADAVKVKGNIHWVSAKHGIHAKVHLYDRLFKTEHPGSQNENYLDDLNPHSKTTITVVLEENCLQVKPFEQYQFERHGYFICDTDSTKGSIEFNRTVTLRDTWK